ncbi:LOW QUALITY PROTEIN: Nuc_sug_transp domain-containing protein [Cephalotus follicularis]|uniref:Nuc_sug_transp domain-containing protein n=1 Tax=Cephalotus follicularis TaxID=3775 RepID=A0A1Q3DC72_CEPFO|nr:LOW QUALITY PROTEIN: Nuc_sug_transp domain-containing protein [Cephalotus follicularis]
MKNGMIECSVCHSRLVSPTTKTVSRAYDQHKIRVSSKQRALNVLLVVGDCVLVGFQPILVYMSKVDGKFKFSPISVNFLTEVAKVLFAVVMLLIQARNQKVGEKPLLSVSTFVQAARNNALLAVPAFLYAVNNYLKFIMQLYFNPATVKMLSNLKVLVIAVLLKMVMKRRFSIIQWEALALLLIGISVNQLRSLPEGTTAMGLPVATGAYIYTLIFVTVPSMASVYNEYALKSQYDTSIYLQNLFLYGYGAIFNFLAILGIAIVKGPSSFDILQGHSKATMLLIANNAAQGILSSFFFKYADTILKKYSSTVATIFTGIASAALFGHTLTMNFLLGISIVFISMHQFFSPLAKVKDEQQNGKLELIDVQENHRHVPFLPCVSKDPFINIAAGANEETKEAKAHLFNICPRKNSSINTLPYSISSSFSPFTTKTWHHHYHYYKPPHLSFSTKRRRSRTSRKDTNTNPNNNNNNPIIAPSIDNQNINLVLDINQLSSKFNLFLSSGRDAFRDLQTFISIDDNKRVLVSCRKSTLYFVGNLVVLGCVVGFAIRVLVNLVHLGLGFKGRFGANPSAVMVRRDRSLGGREVIVGTMGTTAEKANKERRSVFDNPLSLDSGPGRLGFGSGYVGRDWRENYRVPGERTLPKWWPVSVGEPILVLNQEEYQREANRLIRAIMDYRTRGKDIADDDIIQLRRICRTSGVRVSIDITNTRDAFYRASIDFVLNVCSSASSHSSSIEIDGEDARQFIAGLAENVGLENIRAARMVSAAIAARTRSWFLQAWALELRGNRSEVALELSKICCVFRIFPPDESSPEMEMVARGLEKHLKVGQREFLLNMIVGVCCEKSQKIAAEALGLMLPSEGDGEQQENTYM